MPPLVEACATCRRVAFPTLKRGANKRCASGAPSLNAVHIRRGAGEDAGATCRRWWRLALHAAV